MRAAHQESLGQGVLIAGYVLDTRTWCHPINRWFAERIFPTRRFPSQLVRPEPIQVTTCLFCNPAEHARLKRVVWILKSCKKTKYCQSHNGLVSFMLTKKPYTKLLKLEPNCQIVLAKLLLIVKLWLVTKRLNTICTPASTSAKSFFWGSSMTKVTSIKSTKNRSRCNEFVTNKARQINELGSDQMRGLVHLRARNIILVQQSLLPHLYIGIPWFNPESE